MFQNGSFDLSNAAKELVSRLPLAGCRSVLMSWKSTGRLAGSEELVEDLKCLVRGAFLLILFLFIWF
jgi:hypothetical protein